MKFKPSNFSKAELDHNTSSDPFQNVLPNEKTGFRVKTSVVDDNNADVKLQTPVFAYPGTDKGVEK